MEQGESRLRYTANQLIRLHVTVEEKSSLREHAFLPDVLLSAHVCTRFFGGRPLISRTDECTICELSAYE